jgi:hypothetical protein
VMNGNGCYPLLMQLSLFYIVWLTSYSTRLLQLSNDAKLVMADGAYESY